LPYSLIAQGCNGAELLIETSLGDGQVCENSVANVSVDVTPQSDFPLSEIDSIRWVWYVDGFMQAIDFEDIIPEDELIEFTYPPFGSAAQNSHLYNELINLGCDVLDQLISISPNGIVMSIGTTGYVTCSNGDVEQHDNTVGIDLYLLPRADLSIAPSTICLNETTDFINNGCFEDESMSYWTLDGTIIQNNSSDIEDFSPTGTGTFEICLHLVNNCGEDEACKNLTVIPEPNALFSIPLELQDGEACAGTYEFCNISDTINFFNVEYYWSLFLNGSLVPPRDTQLYKDCLEYPFTTPGDYEIVLTATNFQCDTAEYNFFFTILPSAFASLSDPPTECITDFTGYTPNVSYMGNILSYDWTFENGTPGSSTDPNPMDISFPVGTHSIILEIVSDCGVQTYQTIITISDTTAITFSPIENVYCTGQEDTIKIIPSQLGGVWNSSLVFNDSCIAIDDLSIGDNTLTYSLPTGACTSMGSITIHVVDTTAIDFDVEEETFCEDDGIVALGGFTPVGGTWSGTGVIDADNGIIDVSLIGVGNEVTLFYTYTNAEGCTSIANKSVLIEGLPDAVLPRGGILLCDIPGTVDLDAELDIQLPAGYTDEWIGNCVSSEGVIDPVCLGIGVYSLEYIVFTTNGCEDTTQFTVQIDSFRQADAGVDLSECVSNGGTITLIGSPAGGTWEGLNISPT